MLPGSRGEGFWRNKGLVEKFVIVACNQYSSLWLGSRPAVYGPQSQVLSRSLQKVY